jgi:predicted metalloprotease with PDZ domain
VDTLDPNREFANMPLLKLSQVGSLMYSEEFFTGRTLFSKGALMAEEIDVLIRQKTGGKKRLRDSFHAMMSWAVGTRVSSRRVTRVDWQASRR